MYVGFSEEIAGTAVSRVQFGVRLREVSAHGRYLQAEVRLYYLQ